MFDIMRRERRYMKSSGAPVIFGGVSIQPPQKMMGHSNSYKTPFSVSNLTPQKFNLMINTPSSKEISRSRRLSALANFCQFNTQGHSVRLRILRRPSTFYSVRRIVDNDSNLLTIAFDFVLLGQQSYANDILYFVSERRFTSGDYKRWNKYRFYASSLVRPFGVSFVSSNCIANYTRKIRAKLNV